MILQGITTCALTLCNVYEYFTVYCVISAQIASITLPRFRWTSINLNANFEQSGEVNAMIYSRKSVRRRREESVTVMYVLSRSRRRRGLPAIPRHYTLFLSLVERATHSSSR